MFFPSVNEKCKDKTCKKIHNKITQTLNINIKKIMKIYF